MPENMSNPKLKLLDLFSGIRIGGFSLGLERTGGFETVAFCEIEDFPRKVLAKHWPEVPCYDDVRTLTAESLQRDGIGVDAICGGFPCQDLSVAGKQAGIDADRSGLWSEIARLVGEIRPRFLLVENVANLLAGPSEQPGGWFGRVLADLDAIGYDAGWECIPAAYVGAPHRRDRIWLIANPKGERCAEAWKLQRQRLEEWLSRCCETSDDSYAYDGLKQSSRRADECEEGLAPSVAANREQERVQRFFEGSFRGFEEFSWCQNVGSLTELRGRSDLPEPTFRGSRDGVPNWVDRIAGCGNAVVPQIPELIGNAYLESIGWRSAA